MMNVDPTNYQRIAEAINYIKQHFTQQPSLDEVARVVGISPYHFQRLFSQWAGVSPKKFTQYLSVEYAKQLLRADNARLLDVAYQTGLSGTGRLHDLFVNIEAMTPGQYKNGGECLQIDYCFFQTAFGKAIVAATTKGLCHLFFEEDENEALINLKRRFPKAQYQQETGCYQQDAMRIFQQDWQQITPITLHLYGTAFQLKVWSALLKLPLGTVASYGNMAKSINNAQASRAVGTAIGKNPIAFLIPCHRVIQASGEVGGYRWGSTRKSAIIAWEAANVSNNESV